MALDLKISIQKASDCSKITVFDKTGAFDANTNPGGYGAPNPDISEVTAAKLEVTFPGASAPINIDVLPTLPTLTNVGFDITITGLGLTGDSLPDGLYTINYVLDGIQIFPPDIQVAFSASVLCQIVLLCAAECCVDKEIAALALLACDCKSNSERIEQIFLADVLLDGANSAACCGDIECFDQAVELLTAICEDTNCNTC